MFILPHTHSQRSIPVRPGIYAIRQRTSGKCYIGSAVDLQSRWRVHKHDLLRQKHHSSKLQNAWNKYGAEAFCFVILDYVDDPYELIVTEQAWLDALHPFYNILPRAGSILGSKRTPETIEKMRRANIGRIGRRGWRASEETRRKLSVSHLNQRPSAEHREKIRARHLELLSVTAIATAAGITEPVLGVKDVAGLTGFTHSNILKYIHAGTLPAVLVGRVWVIRRADLDTVLPYLLQRRQKKVDPPKWGAQNYCARLTDADVLTIRTRYAAKQANTTQLMKEYNVSKSTIREIISRHTWKHI